MISEQMRDKKEQWISDIEFQKKVWLRGEGSKISSFEEAICRLFDDYDFDGFIKQLSSTEQNQKKFILLSRYRDVLTDYLNSIEDNVSIDKLLNDEKWIEICSLGGEVCSIFKNC